MSYLDTRYTLARRREIRQDNELVYWYCAHTGTVILPARGEQVSVTKNMELSQLLDRVKAHASHSGIKDVTLFIRTGLLVADRPRKAWYASYKEWRQVYYVPDNLHALYTNDDFTVHMYGTHEYFGDEQDIAVIYRAYKLLNSLLARAFHLESYTVRSTPANTGKDLLELSLPREAAIHPLNESLQDLLYTNLRYQGRYEVLPKQHEQVSGIYAIDGTWMYASCISHLPIGEPTIDELDRFEGTLNKQGFFYPSLHGFYLATITVPAHWQHIGLVKSPVNVEGSQYYPNTPNETFTNWTTASELAVAITSSWDIRIHKRILWQESKLDALANWRRYLVDLRSSLPDTPREYKLVKSAIRSIVLHTIGSFSQVYEPVERFTPYRETFPDGVKILRRHRTTSKGTQWTEGVSIAAWKKKFSHIEWACLAWGKARARLAAFSLRLPYEHIVSLRSDCVWALSCPSWIAEEQTGKPGNFRQKDYTESLQSWPDSNAAMRNFVLRYNASKGTYDTDEGKEYTL